jgi:hypothetical protein
MNMKVVVASFRAWSLNSCKSTVGYSRQINVTECSLNIARSSM